MCWSMKYRIGSLTEFPPQLRRDLGGDLLSQPLRPFISLPELFLDLLPVIEVIRQRRVDVGQGDAREHLDNLIRAKTTLFVPDDDIHDTDPVAGDTSPSATDARCLGNMLLENARHRLPRFVNS